MTPSDKVALLGVVLASLLGLLNLVVLIKHGTKIAELHIQLNSGLEAWVKAAKEASHAQGKAEGVEQERDRAQG